MWPVVTEQNSCWLTEANVVSTAQRDGVVRGFRSGSIWVLICTDVMCRGMDFKGVNLVVNYDFPNSDYVYIHRIGNYYYTTPAVVHKKFGIC